MAKRFIDTELFNDSWFMNLPPTSKLFFIYLITNCNQAGIIDLNIRLAEFQTGIKELANSLETVWKQFGEKRVLHLGDNYYFLPNFVRYQYPNGLNTNVKAQLSVIEKLKEFNINHITLSKQLGNSLLTVQDKDIYKDKDTDKDKDIKGGMGEKLNAEAFAHLIPQLMEYFGFSEMRNADKQSQVFTFLSILQTDGCLHDFEEQFTAYQRFKERSGEARYAFQRFLGTIDARFMDGGWNARNWSHELANLPDDQRTGKTISLVAETKNVFAKLNQKQL